MRDKEKFVVLGAVSLLLIPLIAMQFTDEVRWGLFDFMVGGVLLLGAALAYVFAARMISKPAQRVLVGAAVAIVLLAVWVELAVGVFGTAFAGS